MTPEEKLDEINELIFDVPELPDGYPNEEAVIRDEILNEIFRIINER